MPLEQSVLFLARFLGTPAQAERLSDALAGLGATGGADISAEQLRRLMSSAGLAASRLPEARSRRATEMPALVLGKDGRAVVVLALEGGRFECHIPGIEGSSWLDASALAGEVGEARWYAVRPRLFFDQRSLLYALPESG